MTLRHSFLQRLQNKERKPEFLSQMTEFKLLREHKMKVTSFVSH